MVSLFYMALFGLIMLVVMSLVSNSGEQSIENIEEQLFIFNCPSPLANQLINSTHPSVTIEGFTLKYNTRAQPDGAVIYDTNGTGTFFVCGIDELSPGNGFTISLEAREYGTTAFGVIPIGYFGYILDTVSNGVSRLVAMFTLVSFVLTPVNFSILGYTLADLTGLAVMTVVGLYALSYTFIGIFLYKAISPFAGFG